MIDFLHIGAIYNTYLEAIHNGDSLHEELLRIECLPFWTVLKKNSYKELTLR